ncbi:MAG: proline iminopeptidase-family hydrolase [Chitinophagaceae bacterium]|nr:proline iminopeptidase-family hydrolase [Chitinophagaceae bacterium]
MYHINNTKRYATLFAFIIIVLFAGCRSTPQLKAGEGYVTVKGGKIWYRILGEGKQTPLLMLHGGPGGTSKSFYQFASLGEDRPVIIFDQLGSGRSGYHTDTTLLKVENFVEQVEALKTSLGLKEFYLHGHSWGTALALEYYLKYPKGIKAIIFNSPYFSTSLWKADADTLITTLPDSIQLAIKTGEKNHDYGSPAYKNANEVFYKNFGVRKTKLTSELDTSTAKGNEFIYNYMWGPTEFTAAGTLINYNRVQSLKTIKVPTLFITGEFDEARPVTVKYFQSLVPNSKFVMIDGAGHGTMHDNKRQNISAVKNFLDSLEIK